MKNAAKRVFSCRDRRRYSRKRSKFCRKFAKNWQLPYGSTTLRGGMLRPSGVRGALRGVRVNKIGKFCKMFADFVNFWQARSRLYQNEILQETMRVTAFFKLYKICILLHRCNLKILAKNRLNAVKGCFVLVLRENTAGPPRSRRDRQAKRNLF